MAAQQWHLRSRRSAPGSRGELTSLQPGSWRCSRPLDTAVLQSLLWTCSILTWNQRRVRVGSGKPRL